MTNDVSYKPVIAYPGGKYYARKILASFLPHTPVNTVLSPFFGGGSFELYLTSLGKHVLGFDKFFVLTQFWKYLLESPGELANRAQQYYNEGMTAELFKNLQNQLKDTQEDSCVTAAKFFVVSRCSYSSTALSGGFSRRASKLRFTQSSIDRVRNFSNHLVSVSQQDAHTAINSYGDSVDLLFLDPPYMLEKSKSKLYGVSGDLHDGFDHKQLHEDISHVSKPFILSYNDSEEVRQLWSDYYIDEVKWNYGLNTTKKSSEIVIRNFRDTRLF